MSMQLPQEEPAPVRIVSSDTLVTPFSAASRIVVSVMPWQMQTNMGEEPQAGEDGAISP